MASTSSTGYRQTFRDPGTAGMLSLILPGLGQMYNGETRKGVLFLTVAFINFLLFLSMFYVSPLMQNLLSLGEGLGLKPNLDLARAMQDGHFGSPVSIILIGFFISFIALAVRDAFDHAALKRRRIYPDMVMEAKEATSGSYIFHFAIMFCLFILTFFFLVPPPRPAQITDIEFIQNQPRVFHKVVAPRKAEHASENVGKHNPHKPVQAPSPAPKAPSQASPSKPAPAAQMPAPLQQPTPRNISRPSPAMPTPVPMQRAVPMRAPALMPRAVNVPMAMPVPVPRAGPRSNMPNPMPMMAVSPMSKSPGMPSLTPVARPTSGGFGLPSSAPSPVSIAHGTGGAPGFSPTARLGSTSGGGIFSGAPAPMGPSGGTGGGRTSSGPTVVAVGGSSSGGGRYGGSNAGPAPVAGTTGGSGAGRGPMIAIAPVGPRGGGRAGGAGGEGAEGNPAESGAGKAPSLAAEENINWGPYMADLQRRIKKHWFPPRGSESKRVVVIFKIHADGTLSNPQLSRSCGTAIADKAALDAIENAAPFSPLPKGAPENVDIQFTFDYNVFSGGGRGTLRQF